MMQPPKKDQTADLNTGDNFKYLEITTKYKPNGCKWDITDWTVHTHSLCFNSAVKISTVLILVTISHVEEEAEKLQRKQVCQSTYNKENKFIELNTSQSQSVLLFGAVLLLQKFTTTSTTEFLQQY